jgi:hypothetical protein
MEEKKLMCLYYLKDVHCRYDSMLLTNLTFLFVSAFEMKEKSVELCSKHK